MATTCLRCAADGEEEEEDGEGDTQSARKQGEQPPQRTCAAASKRPCVAHVETSAKTSPDFFLQPHSSCEHEVGEVQGVGGGWLGCGRGGSGSGDGVIPFAHTDASYHVWRKSVVITDNRVTWLEQNPRTDCSICIGIKFVILMFLPLPPPSSTIFEPRAKYSFL